MLAGACKSVQQSCTRPLPSRSTVNWIEGSIAGLFLMGAGGHLRWVEHPELRSMMDAIIDGIDNCTEPDGYLAAFNQSTLATDEHPDYTTSWTVHGFLEVRAGLA